MGVGIQGDGYAGMAQHLGDHLRVHFTKSAWELAKSTSVRLIDGKELADWLDGLREEE